MPAFWAFVDLFPSWSCKFDKYDHTHFSVGVEKPLLGVELELAIAFRKSYLQNHGRKHVVICGVETEGHIWIEGSTELLSHQEWLSVLVE